MSRGARVNFQSLLMQINFYLLSYFLENIYKRKKNCNEISIITTFAFKEILKVIIYSRSHYVSGIVKDIVDYKLQFNIKQLFSESVSTALSIN